MEAIDCPRHEPENPYSYTMVQLAKRTKALKDIAKDYPYMNSEWSKWIYDVIENMPQEEVQEIMDKNLWDKPGRHTKKNEQ
mgnify:CR=1 FL=1